METPSSAGSFSVLTPNTLISPPDFLASAATPGTNQQSVISVSGKKPRGRPPKSAFQSAQMPTHVAWDGIVSPSTSQVPFRMQFDTRSRPTSPTPSMHDNQSSGLSEPGDVNRRHEDIFMEDVSPQDPPSQSPNPSLPSSLIPDASTVPKLSDLPTTRTVKGFPHPISTPGVCERVAEVLEKLDEVKLSPGEFFYTVMDRHSVRYTTQQNGFYRKDSRFFMFILSLMWFHCQLRFMEWMAPFALDMCCKQVAEEFEANKAQLLMNVAHVTPKFLKTWDI